MLLSEWRMCKEIPVIYGILNTITNKWYIGSCRNMRNRMRRHYYYLTHNLHHSSKLLRSWNKYNELDFIVNIIAYIEEDQLNNMFNIEEFYIHKYNSKEDSYNILDVCCPCIPFKLSEEAKQKYKEARSKAVLSFDRFTGEFLKKYKSITEAASDIGTSTSNISRVCNNKLNYIKDRIFVYEEDYDETKKYCYATHHMKGVPKSEEQKLKMKLSNKRAKKVYKYDTNYNLINVYISRSDAERQNGFKKEFLRHRLDSIVDGYFYTYNEIKDIV